VSDKISVQSMGVCLHEFIECIGCDVRHTAVQHFHPSELLRPASNLWCNRSIVVTAAMQWCQTGFCGFECLYRSALSALAVSGLIADLHTRHYFSATAAEVCNFNTLVVVLRGPFAQKIF